MTTAGSWEDKAVPRKPHCSRRDGNNDHPPFSQHICTRLSGYRFHSINNMIYFWPGETTKKNNQEKFGEKYYPVLKPPHLSSSLPSATITVPTAWPMPPPRHETCHPLPEDRTNDSHSRTAQLKPCAAGCRADTSACPLAYLLDITMSLNLASGWMELIFFLQSAWYNAMSWL